MEDHSTAHLLFGLPANMPVTRRKAALEAHAKDIVADRIKPHIPPGRKPTTSKTSKTSKTSRAHRRTQQPALQPAQQQHTRQATLSPSPVPASEQPVAPYTIHWDAWYDQV